MADPTRRTVDLPPFRTDAVYNIAYGTPANVYALVMRDKDGDEVQEVTIKGGVLSWWELRQEQRFYLSMYGSDLIPDSRGYAADGDLLE